MTEKAYFLTVDWCNKGERGVFCHKSGLGYRKDAEPHTHEEMVEILDVFWLVLNPESVPFTEEELGEYTNWYPLAEYSHQFGVAVKPRKEKHGL